MSDETWAVLAVELDAPELVEVLYVVGQYTMLSMVANAAGVTPPSDAAPVPWAGDH